MTKYLLPILVACCASLNAPAFADQLIIATPGKAGETASDALSEIKHAFDSIQPGDGFSLINSDDGSVVASMQIPEDSKYKVASIRERDFTPELQGIVGFIRQRPQTNELPLGSNIPAVSEAIGKLRKNKADRAHILVRGSALYVDPSDPAISMINDEGKVLIPEDGFLLGSKALSPFGGADSQKPLENAFFHLCLSAPLV